MSTRRLWERINESGKAVDNLCKGEVAKVRAYVFAQIRRLSIVKRICRGETRVLSTAEIPDPSFPALWVLKQAMNENNCL